MNTHDIDIELPPLPEPMLVDGEPYWFDSHMQSYARAAIEADRKRITELEAQLEDYKRAVASTDRLVRELDVLINGKEGAAEQASLCDIVCQLEADRKRRGEPVAFSYELATTRSGDGEYIHWSPRLSYSMPNVPDGSIRNLQWLYVAPQPAEPVKVPSDDDVAELSLEFTRMEPLSDFDYVGFARALLARYGAAQPAAEVDKPENLQGSSVDKIPKMQSQPAASAEPVAIRIREKLYRGTDNGWTYHPHFNPTDRWTKEALRRNEWQSLYAAPVAAQPQPSGISGELDAALKTAEAYNADIPVTEQEEEEWKRLEDRK